MNMSGLFGNPSQMGPAMKSLQIFQKSPKERLAIRAWRYWNGTAYEPAYAQDYQHPYIEWDETRKGPRPRIRPVPKRIADLSATFLFGDIPQLMAPDSEQHAEMTRKTPENTRTDTLQQLVMDIWRMNSFDANLLVEARACSLDGGTIYKFAWTPQVRTRPIAVSTLSPFDVQVTRDPLDPQIIESVRIQFKYHDKKSDRWYLHQEVWTDDTYRIYVPLETSENDEIAAIRSLGGEGWPIAEQGRNMFGIIPLVYIPNRVIKGDPDGYGDFWDLFDKIDEYNHTRWLQHHHNQTELNPATILVNAVYGGTSIKPDDFVRLTGQNADIKRLETVGSMREWVEQSATDLRHEIFDGAGYDDVNPEIITNKGNLTRAVWELLNAKNIKTTQEKRVHWGENGLCVLFENILLGLSRLPDATAMYPCLRSIDETDQDTYDIEIRWPEFYPVQPEEMTAVISNLNMAIESGFTTRMRAVEEYATAADIHDVNALMEDLADTHKAMDTRAAAETELAVNTAQSAGVDASVNSEKSNRRPAAK